MQAKQQHTEKLDKVFAMFADSATTVHEKANALDKLQKLCKKYKVNFQDYMQAKDFDLQFEARKQQREAEAKARREAAEAKAYKARSKKRSRRSLIIEMLKSNMFDAESINEALCEVFNYTDAKANKKAISGTKYDLTVNKNYFFRDCSDSRIVTEI